MNGVKGFAFPLDTSISLSIPSLMQHPALALIPSSSSNSQLNSISLFHGLLSPLLSQLNPMNIRANGFHPDFDPISRYNSLPCLIEVAIIVILSF